MYDVAAYGLLFDYCPYQVPGINYTAFHCNKCNLRAFLAFLCEFDVPSLLVLLRLSSLITVRLVVLFFSTYGWLAFRAVLFLHR